MTGRYDHHSREDLIRLLERRDAQQRYGLVWEREGIDGDRAVNDDFVVFDIDPGLSTPPQDARGWRNLVIEGDNWDALRALRLAYAARVKCILIDPPYNTGNRDFAYNDRFVGAEDRFRHSTWLEFLYRRLILARDLLADDGVILVCINDENRARLDLLMEQVFPGMRVGSFVWRTKDTANNTSNFAFSGVHEHVMIYAGPAFRFVGVKAQTTKVRRMAGDDQDSRIDPITMAQDFRNRPNNFYPLKNPATDLWYPCSPLRVWSIWSKQKPTRKRDAGPPIEDLIAAGRIHFPDETRKPFLFSTRHELDDALESGRVPKDGKGRSLLTRDVPDLYDWVGRAIAHGRPSLKTFVSASDIVRPVSSWMRSATDADFGDQEVSLRGERQGTGTDVLMQIFGYKPFEFPKPTGLLQQILSVIVTSEDTIVDFFAGSGTTAHAVLALNAEDDGDRRFIMVSNTEATVDAPDKNLCRDVCAERIRRVIAGYGDVPGLGGDFAYLRARRVANPDVTYDFNPAAIWTLLQLRFGRALTPFDPAQPVQLSRSPEQSAEPTLAYAPEASAAALATLAALPEPLAIFCPVPGIVREALARPNLSVDDPASRLIAEFPRNVVGL